MTLFYNARLIDPASGFDKLGAIRTENGLIKDIGDHLTPFEDEDCHDIQGAALAPALVDVRCWADPQSSGVASLQNTSRAAAAGGIASVVIAPDSGKGLSRPEDLAQIDLCGLTSPVRLLSSGLVVDKNSEMGEIGLMIEAGAVMVGDGGWPIADTCLVRRVLSYASRFDVWVSLSCEDAYLSENTYANESDLSTRIGFASRPSASERLAIDRAALLAELTGVQVLFDRVSTREGLAALQTARARGLELTSSAPITHFMFNEIDTAGFDPRFRLDPPLRCEDDRQALIMALQDGAIDVIVSDHKACLVESKAHPFPDAIPGSANLEALLPALCTLCETENIPLVDILRPVTSKPAELLGLDSGRLQVGSPADLVIFNPTTPLVYDSKVCECPSPSAFDERRLFGKVLMTIVHGEIIFQSEG